jgi:hypothetical protein
MREPKPHVVGISWVVECAEQCRRVAEDDFLVDLEGLNVAGNNKVRGCYRHVSILDAEIFSITAPTFDASQTHLIDDANPRDGTPTTWSFPNWDVD